MVASAAAVTKNFAIFAFVAILLVLQAQAEPRSRQTKKSLSDLRTANKTRDAKFLSFFQLVTFPNEGCGGSDSKNGTCYTSDECKNKGGTASGSCAEGYGVCCTFSLNCGAMSSENNTYFENTGSEVGECVMSVCPINSKISQLRLDFNTFAINGPSTETLSVGAHNGVAIIPKTRCLIDTFAVTSPGNPATPVLCGTLTNEHMYVDASQSCNDLTFLLGQTGTGMRQWSIKVSQYESTFTNLAPEGCTQYFYGTTSGTVTNYNFDQGLHLANQRQKICFRRETNQCRICYSINDFNTDFSLSGGATAAVKGSKSSCCGYGTDGAKSSGYDCLVIPQASMETSMSMQLKFSEFCGSKVTFMDFATANSKTICSKRIPFEITFLSDNSEFDGTDENANSNQGFRLDWFQAGGC